MALCMAWRRMAPSPVLSRFAVLGEASSEMPRTTRRAGLGSGTLSGPVGAGGFHLHRLWLRSRRRARCERSRMRRRRGRMRSCRCGAWQPPEALLCAVVFREHPTAIRRRHELGDRELVHPD